MDTPFVVQKYTCYFRVLGPENTPTPYMSGTLVLDPPVLAGILFENTEFSENFQKIILKNRFLLEN